VGNKEKFLHPFLKRVDDQLHKLNKKRPWLSDKANISLSNINNWFAYNRLPRIDDGKAIADALDISLDYLMTGKKNQKPQFDDPILEELCNYLMNASRDDLLQFRALAKLLPMISLKPEEISSKKAGA
jgi:transcriptional regulator with XRE-family HTH domain